MALSPDMLSVLQRSLLKGVAILAPHVFLTGGSALGGFHLHHRVSKDLDLFVTPPHSLDEVERALAAAAATLGGATVTLERFPDFRRFLVTGQGETTLVDLVLDRAPQLAAKMVMDGLQVDPLEEIAANKVCALFGRNEVRDLVDLRAILAHGVTLVEAVAGACIKDGGVSAAALAFVLSQWSLPAGAGEPYGVLTVDLEAFRVLLMRQLLTLGLPLPPP